jgi:hypothetical protein
MMSFAGVILGAAAGSSGGSAAQKRPNPSWMGRRERKQCLIMVE